MTSTLPLFLVFDTSGPWCVVALSQNDVVIAFEEEELSKGQAECLLPMAERVLAQARADWSEITAIGVGIGPGNFTGIRIAVSAARGLSLGLGKPAIPLSAFELLRQAHGHAAPANELVVAEAPRGQVYGQLFRHGRPDGKPEQFDPATPPDHLNRPALIVTGYHADQIAQHYGANAVEARLDDLPNRLARVMSWKWAFEHDLATRPAPLYVRSADAAPPKDPAPVLLP